MRQTAIRGIIVPVITPMDELERVNEQQLRAQIDRQIDAGVHGIFCLGTNGEAYALNEQEKRRVIACCVEHVAGRVPVYAGTGCVTTAETVELSRWAVKAGADVLSVITPWFAAISQEQLYRHYAELTDSVDAPVLVYHIPARTGAAITPDTMGRMLALPGIAGVKDSSGQFDTMLQYIERARETGKAVLSGNDSLILWNLLAGGAGGIAGCANVYPRTLVSIWDCFQAGDIEGAKEAQRSLQSLRGCFRYGTPNTVIKTAVQMLGYPVGACRKPFDQLSGEGEQALRRVLEENERKGMA